MKHYVWSGHIDERGYALIDGGLATELERRGHRLESALWSAAMLDAQPDAIKGVHHAFLDAGADIIITATYQASFGGFAAAGFDAANARRLMLSAVDLACAARDAHQANGLRRPLVAASIGPYGATLADGSEYRGDYAADADALHTFHQDRLSLLGASGADLLAIETIPSAIEASVLARLIDAEEGPDCWISFSCKDDASLNDGTAIENAVSSVMDVARVGAVGINCTDPKFVETLVRRIARVAPGKDIVVYPNLGGSWDARQKSWDPGVDSSHFEDLAASWYRAGARLIGGCCRTTPECIATTGQRLDSLRQNHPSTLHGTP
jgi:homocysteine S-methyltransferase